MKLYKLKFVAELMHCHPSTIYRWVAERKIPYIKSGHRLLFQSEDIEKWLLDHRVPSVEEGMFNLNKSYEYERV